MSYRCKECNSDLVEGQFWVNHNTFKIESMVDEDPDQNWCQQCQEKVEIYDDELENNDNDTED